MARARNRWGWGFAGRGHRRRARRGPRRPASSQALGFGSTEVEQPSLPTPALPAPRVAVPAALAAICSADDRDRACHSLGKSYLDTVRALPRALRARRRPRHRARAARPTSRPRSNGRRARTSPSIPYGGGTSVVGGVEPRSPGDVRRRGLARPRRARPRARGRPGLARGAHRRRRARARALEEQLGAHGLTMRFYPQSFELSTLGGWIATRAGGHFAVGPTHVDDLVEAVRAITPSGTWASRRLPGSGAGPSPDRMLLGSEGILGVITEAWVRVQPRPSHRAGRTVRFASLPGRRRGGARHRTGRPAARQLPPRRRAGSAQTRRGRRRARHARARLRVHRPRRRARPGPRARALPRARRRARRAAAGGRDGAGRVARGLSAHALPARHARRASGSSPTPSRPPSRGSACRPSTRP